jgi:carbamoyltransferase
MYFLGINGGWHDNSACLIEDNKIIAFVEEERFVNVKHSPGYFPLNAIKFCLKEAGIKISDVDEISYFLKPSFKLFSKRSKLSRPTSFINSYLNTKSAKTSPIYYLKNYFRTDKKINYIEHHLCHAASSFYLSGFKKANILSIDGVGEGTSTLMAFGNKKNIEKIKEMFYPNSLGILYSIFTDFLGFKANSDEGKVMGLAPYGIPKYDFFKMGIIKFEEGGYKINEKIINYLSFENPSLNGVKNFGEPRRFRDINENDKNIAASLQDALEKTIVHISEWVKDQTGSDKFCLAGGVALNCKANGYLLEQDFVNDIFIQPAAGDAGTALGAALITAMNYGFKFSKMNHVYFGPSYTDEYIEKELKIAKIPYEKISDPSGTAAELLAQGKIVGWFQGRMEAGPRALGNRSILADPRDPEIKDKLNYLVKHREPFRPFCPSLLDKAKKEYLENAYESPFMILSFKVPEEKRKEIPGVVHVDGTVRPQTVTKEANPKYYKLISEFEKLTGVPVVLNTSFNDKGQPIVENPGQAVKMFFGTGMDALIIENFLIKK